MRGEPWPGCRLQRSLPANVGSPATSLGVVLRGVSSSRSFPCMGGVPCPPEPPALVAPPQVRAHGGAAAPCLPSLLGCGKTVVYVANGSDVRLSRCRWESAGARSAPLQTQKANRGQILRGRLRFSGSCTLIDRWQTQKKRATAGPPSFIFTFFLLFSQVKPLCQPCRCSGRQRGVSLLLPVQ